MVLAILVNMKVVRGQPGQGPNVIYNFIGAWEVPTSEAKNSTSWRKVGRYPQVSQMNIQIGIAAQWQDVYASFMVRVGGSQLVIRLMIICMVRVVRSDRVARVLIEPLEASSTGWRSSEISCTRLSKVPPNCTPNSA